MEAKVKKQAEVPQKKAERKNPFVETLRFHREVAEHVNDGLPLTEEQKAQLVQPI